RVPLVWEVNGTSAEIRHWNPDLFVYPGTRPLERWTLNAASAVFVVSDELRLELEKEGVDGGASIAVIPNGADPDRFHPDVVPDPLRGAIADDAAVVGFLGSFSSWHDIETMSAAMHQVAQRDRRVRFVLAGATFPQLSPGVQQTLGPIRDRLIM